MNSSALRGMARTLLYLVSFLAMEVAVAMLVLSSLERTPTPMPVVGQYVLAVPFSLVFSWLVQGLIIRIVLVCRVKRRIGKKRS